MDVVDSRNARAAPHAATRARGRARRTRPSTAAEEQLRTGKRRQRTEIMHNRCGSPRRGPSGRAARRVSSAGEPRRKEHVNASGKPHGRDGDSGTAGRSLQSAETRRATWTEFTRRFAARPEWLFSCGWAVLGRAGPVRFGPTLAGLVASAARSFLEGVQYGRVADVERAAAAQRSAVSWRLQNKSTRLRQHPRPFVNKFGKNE